VNELASHSSVSPEWDAEANDAKNGQTYVKVTQNQPFMPLSRLPDISRSLIQDVSYLAFKQ
jgi:hypothetical protein